MPVLMGEIGDGEGVEAEFFVGGGERGGEGEVDVLAWVEGGFVEGGGEGDDYGDEGWIC